MPSNDNSESHTMKLGKHILVVDDVIKNIKLLIVHLREAGYEISFANSGKQAFISVDRHQPDLILLDINIPEMDGFEICRRFKSSKTLANIPIIFLTADGDTGKIEKGFELGAVDFITKPFRFKEVKARLETHLAFYEVKQQLEIRNEELQNAYDKLSNTQLQLVQTAKLAGIGELATGITHELNQPLMYIRANTQMEVKDGLEGLDPESAFNTLKIVEEGTDRMMNIINHLKDFARISDICFLPVNMNEIIEKSLILFREQFKNRNIQITKEFDQNLPEVVGDANRLEQVFINLLSNAKDALSGVKKGSIHLKTIQCKEKSKENFIEVSFTDNGLGIPESKLDKIFEPFFTTKDVGRGTGLGLSVSHGIIKDHNGDFVVDSQEGKGTTFKIFIPLDSGE